MFTRQQATFSMINLSRYIKLWMIYCETRKRLACGIVHIILPKIPMKTAIPVDMIYISKWFVHVVKTNIPHGTHGVIYNYCICAIFEVILKRTITPVNDRIKWIDLCQEYRNELSKYLAMHHLVTEMFTHVTISVTKWCIVWYGTCALWGLWNRYIKMQRPVPNGGLW